MSRQPLLNLGGHVLEADPDHPRKTCLSEIKSVSQIWSQVFGGCSRVFHGRFTGFSRRFSVFSWTFHTPGLLGFCINFLMKPIGILYVILTRSPDTLIIQHLYMGVKQKATHGRALAPRHF